MANERFMLFGSSTITYALEEELCFYLLLGCHIAICSQCALLQEVSQSVQIIITPINIKDALDTRVHF